jgi:uncharacterized protein YukE
MAQPQTKVDSGNLSAVQTAVQEAQSKIHTLENKLWGQAGDMRAQAFKSQAAGQAFDTVLQDLQADATKVNNALSNIAQAVGTVAARISGFGSDSGQTILQAANSGSPYDISGSGGTGPETRLASA